MEELNQNDSLLSDINVTSFVDILLVLLFIFMITAPAMTRSIGVELPTSKWGDKSENSKVQKKTPTDFIVIGLTRGGEILFSSKKYRIDQFYSQFPKLIIKKRPKKIFIQADRKVAYEKLLHLMVYLKNHGHEDIGLVFKEKR